MKIKLLFFIVSLGFVFPAISQAASDETVNKKCTAIYQTPIAVFIEPSDKEIESMKKEVGEEDFYTIADDAIYYQWQATEYLEKMKFPYCFTENERHTFKTSQNKQYTINEKCEDWCLILWNGKDEPLPANAVDIFTHEAYLKRAGLE